LSTNVNKKDMQLREFLDQERITYREFAEKLGIHIQSAKNIAYGVRKPGLKLALQIEEFTGGKVTPRELMEYSNEPTKSKPKRKYVSKRLPSE
jgi:transcriptional regulator with XRE-family HTH domain